MRSCVFDLGLILCLTTFCNALYGTSDGSYGKLAELRKKPPLLSIAQQVVSQSDDQLSPRCLDDLLDIIELKEWSIKMLDAGGKLPHGILRGNLNSIGQYQGCIGISYEKPSWNGVGQHCMSSLIITFSFENSDLTDLTKMRKLPDLLANFENMNKELVERQGRITSVNRNEASIEFNIGICLPSTCEAKVLNFYLNTTNQILPVKYMIKENTCTIKKNDIELTPGDIGAISFFSVIGFIVLCSTLYDIWYRIFKNGDTKNQKQIFIAFSAYTNSEKLFTSSKNPGPVACIHGIRVISLLWIVLGHRYSMSTLSPYENILDIFDWLTKLSSSILVGSSVSVDTFFVLSGFLLSYTFFRSAKLGNAARDLPLFYIHRILRLTPLLMATILFVATLAKHFMYGPLTEMVTTSVTAACNEEWWTYLLYINNYVGNNMCLGQAWYLAIDMQLYVLSPLILYPLLWNKNIGITWMLFCIAIAQSTAAAIAFTKNYAAGVLVDPESKYFEEFYVYAFTRATPYFMGVFAGYVVLQELKKKNIKTIQYNFTQQNILVKCLIVYGWICSLVLMGIVLFGYHNLNQKTIDEVTPIEDSLYIAFSRTVWSLGLLWVIVACAFGFGGPINWFLSLPIFEILARFSYAVYLNHGAIQATLVVNENHMRLFSHMKMVVDFFGDLFISYAMAFVFILAIESPIVVLEKIIFKRGKHKTDENVEKQYENNVQIINQPMNNDKNIQINDGDNIQIINHPLNDDNIQMFKTSYE